jgi:hypothetical protein
MGLLLKVLKALKSNSIEEKNEGLFIGYSLNMGKVERKIYYTNFNLNYPTSFLNKHKSILKLLRK